jgi:hypothetical protein
LTNIIIVVAVTLLLGLFFKVAKNSKVVMNSEGAYILRYSNAIKWSCMGMVLFSFFGLTALLIKNPIKDDGDFSAVVGLYVAILIFGAYFYIEFFTVKILVSKNGIIGASGWRGTREYSWQEIDEISYSPASMWFKVSSRSKAPLRIHALITGIDTFQKFYIENLPEEKWVNAHNKFPQN